MRKVIQLTESDIHRMVMNSVRRYMTESGRDHKPDKDGFITPEGVYRQYPNTNKKIHNIEDYKKQLNNAFFPAYHMDSDIGDEHYEFGNAMDDEETARKFRDSLGLFDNAIDYNNPTPEQRKQSEDIDWYMGGMSPLAAKQYDEYDAWKQHDAHEYNEKASEENRLQDYADYGAEGYNGAFAGWDDDDEDIDNEEEEYEDSELDDIMSGRSNVAEAVHRTIQRYLR